ncbi:MAG: GNAT family N-acetyltransferase [Alphaproteobacteria bacterium]|nr:GNAT family N-acetyltransferase [Alphaproteobacteria bacterium]
MQAQLISNKNQWDKALSNFSERDIYFEYDYHALYINNDHECAEAFYFFDNEKQFFFPYIKQNISGHNDLFDFETVYGYTGPLSTTDDVSFLEKAWETFKQTAENNGIVCGLIRFNPLLDNSSITTPDYIEKIGVRETVYVDLEQSYEEIWKTFKKGTKSDIKKANKEGLTKKILYSEEDYISFYNYYVDHMKQLGTTNFYFFKKDCFLKLCKMGAEKSKIYFACLGDKIIGGSIILYSSKFCHYHLSWSLYDYRNYRPNKFLLNEVIKDAIDSGYKYFHLGGGITNEPDDSLFAFKKHFSKKTKMFQLGKVMIDSEKYKDLCEEWNENSSLEIKEQYKSYFLKYKY